MTLLTVGIADHLEMIRTNVELIKKLNPSRPLKFVIVDNSENQVLKNAIPDSDQVKVISGVEPDKTLPSNCRGSYHHAAALNKGLQGINDDFVCIMDPDFFVLLPDWIEEVVDFMKEQGVAFFGAPWHPRWHIKWRGFPCPHFMIVDLKQVKLEDLNFLPEVFERPHWSQYIYNRKTGKSSLGPVYTTSDRKVPKVGLKLLSMVHKVSQWTKLETLTTYRWRIGSARDTGFKLAENFGPEGLNLKTYLLKPVIDFKNQFPGQHLLVDQNFRNLEKFLPSGSSYLPHNTPYVESAHFPLFNNKIALENKVEGFEWQGGLFGVHFRCNITRSAGGDLIQTPIVELLKDLDSSVDRRFQRHWES